MQSRGPRLNDVLSAQDVNEIANVPRGLTSSAAEAEQPVRSIPELTQSVDQIEQDIQGTRRSVEQIRQDGKEEVGRN